MPRPRKPTKVLEAKGAFRKDPQRRRDGEPEVREPLGAVPGDLNALQVKAWQEIVSFAPMGVLTQADRLVVEMAACLLAEYREDRGGFSGQKLGRLEAMLGKFGMTPSDRAKLSIEKPKTENPFDRFS